MKRRLVFYQSVVFSFLVLVSCSSDGSREANADYERLCGIYEDLARKSTDAGLKDYAIAERVESEMPLFYEEYFKDIMYMDRDKRYQTIKKLAENGLSDGESWDCKVMQDYFGGDYERVSDP
jgi:hypothetical protein